MKKYITTLTIAGSDSGGGAGIQADLKTFSALGCYGMSVITALTAQNTRGVQAVHPVSPLFVELQLKSIFDDIKVDAVKIGMIHSKETVEKIASFLTKWRTTPLVLDPVMMAKDGSPLLQKDAIISLVQKLFPLTHILTPNIKEAKYLLRKKINDELSMEKASQKICSLGPKAVLIKGGHLTSKISSDCLCYDGGKKIKWFKSTRIRTPNTHGTGCTLSAAIAAFLAKGFEITTAIDKAKKYLNNAILAGSEYQLGAGYGPVKHDWGND